MRRLRLLVVLFVVAGTAFACGGGASGGNTRQVLVDYNNPDFANLVLAYFPSVVNVHPGDTVHFKQAWNGEPHSVTMGTLVETALDVVNPLLQKYPGGEGAPPEAEDTFNKAFEPLPFMFGDAGPSEINQMAAQPCFLDKGTPPPSDPKKPCARRVQPAFDGTQPYYSSGFIPYAGNNGNSFEVKLSKDLKPGTYHYYCNLHGPEMQGRIVVKPKGASIPSQTQVDKAALSEAKSHVKPVAEALDKIAAGPFDIVKAIDIAKLEPPLDDQLKATIKGYALAGYGVQAEQSVLANEFLPKTIHAQIGEKVTWAFFGIHTVSFDVPRYFPLLIIQKDGTVKLDDRAGLTRGSGFPDTLPDNAPNPFIVDGGSWNGSGFRSSGFPPDTNGPNQVTAYSLTFTKAGTYQYACLIHPKMVGTVIVK